MVKQYLGGNDLEVHSELRGIYICTTGGEQMCGPHKREPEIWES